MKQSTRSRRPRRRPRTRRLERHQKQELLWPESGRPHPVFRQRQVRIKAQERGQVTAYGGLALAHDLAMRLQIDRDLNQSLSLLKRHVPYFESDHVLTHAYNLFVGGGCIEDIGHVQHSEAIKNLLGACRIPDPTTAGDFLRRFRPRDLETLQAVIDRARQKVWRKLPRRQRKIATIDLDSTIKEVYGACKQGAAEVLGGVLPMIKDPGVKGREFTVSSASFTNAGLFVRDVDDRERTLTVSSDTTITTEEWSLMYNPEPDLTMLFHLPSDPKQENNVVSRHPDVAKELHQLFVAFMKETNVAEEIMKPRLELKI